MEEEDSQDPQSKSEYYENGNTEESLSFDDNEDD